MDWWDVIRKETGAELGCSTQPRRSLCVCTSPLLAVSSMSTQTHPCVVVALITHQGRKLTFLANNRIRLTSDI